MSTAEQFDRQVKSYEKLRENGKDFRREREALLQHVRGDVLEIAPGPGFNFPFYKNINSLTAVDLSPKMIESAKKKWEQMSDIQGEFIAADINEVQFAASRFDTVVSTCSLCAYDDPVAVLNKLARWCKLDGTIYLLEHGLSDYFLVRLAQQLYEPIHYSIHACHCNRDIRDIVERSDLDIVSIEKPRKCAPIDFLYSIVAQPGTDIGRSVPGRGGIG